MDLSNINPQDSLAGLNTQVSLSDLNRDQLRSLASQNKIPGRGSMNKAQLVEALSGHQQGAQAVQDFLVGLQSRPQPAYIMHPVNLQIPIVQEEQRSPWSRRRHQVGLSQKQRKLKRLRHQAQKHFS